VTANNEEDVMITVGNDKEGIPHNNNMQMVIKQQSGDAVID